MEREMPIGKTIRGLRHTRGLTIQQLADRAGMSKTGVAFIERGHTQPTMESLDKLSGALGVSIAELFSDPLGEARRESLERWLGEHGATRILMSDEEVVANFERLASGSDRQDIPERFEQETQHTFQEEAGVSRVLAREFAGGGELLPKVSSGPDLTKRAMARAKEHSRIKREIRARYGRYYRALDRFSEALYLAGQADDFVMVNQRPQVEEARRQTLQDLRDSALEAAG
jgi:transcriptional regulator with XRE-family HTH domain